LEAVYSFAGRDDKSVALEAILVGLMTTSFVPLTCSVESATLRALEFAGSPSATFLADPFTPPAFKTTTFDFSLESLVCGEAEALVVFGWSGPIFSLMNSIMAE
jgi:hypothetical protein